ncbi:MAG: hypothetical protein EA343_23145 [Nodularia sp. (in: Bacteria)]|nr:MAG: hypothetical protein EA343_23145 [Nodularia sp. (in: cyanobacteria)]
MAKTSSFNVIMQQLDALSLAELLEVKAGIDALVEAKSSPFSQIQQYFANRQYNYLIPATSIRGRYRQMTFVSSQTRDIDIVHFEGHFEGFVEPKTNGDDSLEKVIGLVDEWMADPSGYDEETYPEIEAALNQNTGYV